MKMKQSSKRWVATGILAGMAALPVATNADTIKDILVGGGIAVAVSQFGGEIDKAINKVTGTRKTAVESTKVVPIISAGQGAAVGAVQVMGPKSRVDRVKAVAQLEGSASRARFKALIPVDTMNPGKNPSRVRGVGVSGIIDLRL